VVERSAAGGAPEQIEMSTTLDKGKDKPMDARTAFLAAAAAQLHVTPAPRRTGCFSTRTGCPSAIRTQMVANEGGTQVWVQ